MTIKRTARQSRAEAHTRSASASPASKPLRPTTAKPGSPKSARRSMCETQSEPASAPRASRRLKPNLVVPGAPIDNARQMHDVTQIKSASGSPAAVAVKPNELLPGSPIGRQPSIETQMKDATVPPANSGTKASRDMPGAPLSETIEKIRAHHRARRFAMGIQQVLDNKLASFVRINATDWHVDDDEATRAKAIKEAAEIIKAAKKGEGLPEIVGLVAVTEKAREPADAERTKHEKAMESLATQLPVAPWVEAIPGFGMLGLATIIAETGDLAMYSNVAKVWKRLGYAPYNGKAGSTWKRPTWRGGDAALTSEEWTENPFSGKRYALIHTISVWLKNKQWIGAAKTDDGVGKPNGPYAEVYAARRAHTAITHEDWGKQHSHMDALRVMMKAVLKDLYLEWNPHKKSVGRHDRAEALRYCATDRDPGQPMVETRT